MSFYLRQQRATGTFLIGIAMISIAVFAYRQKAAEDQWPRATGVVLSSRVAPSDDGSDFEPRIRLEYDAQGMKRPVTATPALRSDYDTVLEHIQRFPPGAKVELALSPNGEAQYEFGLTPKGQLGIGGLAIGGVLVMLVGAYGMRPRRLPPEEPEARLRFEARQRAIEKLRAAGYLASGVALAGLGIWMVKTIDRSVPRWPTVAAEVVSSTVAVPESRPRRSALWREYDISVQFKYEVDGVPYVSRTTSGNVSYSFERAQRRLAAYARGRRHQISYRRDAPLVIRFDVRNRDTDLLPFAVFGFAALAFVFGVVMWRKLDD